MQFPVIIFTDYYYNLHIR